MNIERAYSRLAGSQADFARFYGGVEGLDWGVGLIAKDIAYPIYDRDEREFTVAVGFGYVLSHECDLDPRNDRPFNDTAVVCPIIPFEIALNDLNASRTPMQVNGFVDALAQNTVSRAVYIPTIADELPYGGLLYLNAITHTNVVEFERPEVEKLCAVSAYGLRYLDYSLHASLLKRPKSQNLPLTGMAQGEAKNGNEKSGFWASLGRLLEK